MPPAADGPRGSHRARAASHDRPWLPPIVWTFGWISLLTDTASEAIYPLLPLFLAHVLGARALALGVIEGAAEATASLLKVVSGRLSDRLARRRPFVVVGYTVSSLTRPAIGLAAAWTHVLALRLADRAGKGLRSAPRDAIIAAVAPPGERGRVFGVHRAMDHAGAIVGPVLASAFLWAAPGAYRALFLLTLIPGLAVIALVARLPREGRPAAAEVEPEDARGMAWRALPAPFWRLMAVMLVFTLGNSTDAYLLLRLSGLGVPAVAIPLLWALLHVVKASTSVGSGLLADRIGSRPVIAAGWLIYAIVYAGFARVTSVAAAVALFVSYGLFFGFTEGVESALVADLTPPGLEGSAFGVYHAVVGIGALAASLVFGAVWEGRSASAAFGLGATLAAAATLLLWLAVPVPREFDGRRRPRVDSR